MKDGEKIWARQERIHVNKLFEAIIAEAEVARRKVKFVEQVKNIRRMSFLIADRIKRFGGEKESGHN